SSTSSKPRSCSCQSVGRRTQSAPNLLRIVIVADISVWVSFQLRPRCSGGVYVGTSVVIEGWQLKVLFDEACETLESLGESYGVLQHPLKCPRSSSRMLPLTTHDIQIPAAVRGLK
ncbi:hypothetical protein KUCAC02_031690, partial [Chaenocephalus aceratus]